MTTEPALTFAELRAANIARQAEWCPDQLPDLSFRGNELAGEVGEACNVIKKLERARHGWRGSRDTVDHLAEELADVVICADLCAITANVDLGTAIARKFNQTSEANGLSVRLAAEALLAAVEAALEAQDAPAKAEVSAAPAEAVRPELEDVGQTPQGYTIFREANGAGGHRYWSDEIGGGVMVWDTCLAAPETLRACLRIEGSTTPTPAAASDGLVERLKRCLDDAAMDADQAFDGDRPDLWDEDISVLISDVHEAAARIEADAVTIEQLRMMVRNDTKNIGEYNALLADPNAVHVNMLRGTIAKPSLAQIEHIYPELSAKGAEIERLTALHREDRQMIDAQRRRAEVAEARVKELEGEREALKREFVDAQRALHANWRSDGDHQALAERDLAEVLRRAALAKQEDAPR